MFNEVQVRGVCWPREGSEVISLHKLLGLERCMDRGVVLLEPIVTVSNKVFKQAICMVDNWQ